MPTEKTLQKYRLVIDEWFVNGFNGTRAYKKFYPKSKKSSAESNFRKILAITRIEEYVLEKKEKAGLILDEQHSSILNELKRWAYSDITQTLTLTPDQVKELPPQVRRLITKFKHTRRHLKDKDGKTYEILDTVELQFVSKEKALEMMNKHVGFYEAHNKQKSTVVHMPPVEIIID